MKLDSLRQEVCHANRMLPELGLVVMHSGNASGYDAANDRIVIKPSGVDYGSLTPEMLVEVEASTGKILSSPLRPSVDLPHHLFLYKNIPGIHGVIHTHSNFATAFAAVHQSIPLCLTAIADEFGGAIPCAPYIDNIGDHIGQAVLKYRTQAPAILLGNHGVFAWGSSPSAALKAAAMTEDVAKTVHYAQQLGKLKLIPAHEARKWFSRYQTTYGQSEVSTLRIAKPERSRRPRRGKAA